MLGSEHFASWTLGAAFGPDADPPDLLDYHVPAAAAWIRILGREIRKFCVVGDWEEFDRDQWDGWKRGFERFWKGEDREIKLDPGVKQVAEIAWRTMCDLENTQP